MCLHLGIWACDEPCHLQWDKTSVKWDTKLDISLQGNIGYLITGQWGPAAHCFWAWIAQILAKWYKQAVLVLGYDIPGAKQEIEAFNYVHITSPRTVDDKFPLYLYTNIHDGKQTFLPGPREEGLYPQLGVWNPRVCLGHALGSNAFYIFLKIETSPISLPPLLDTYIFNKLH